MDVWDSRGDDPRNKVAKGARSAQLVVLLSHNGFDCDRKLAARVEGIDVILTAHTHDALPVVTTVGKTLLVTVGSNLASSSHASTSSVRGMADRAGYPLQADPHLFRCGRIAPDPEMALKIAQVRAPFASELARVVGRSESLLYRRAAPALAPSTISSALRS